MSDKGQDFDFSGLAELAKILETSKKTIKVGIIGDKTSRDDKLTNAEIGLYHEYGTENLPMRSFLRLPLAEYLPARLEELGAYSNQTLKEAVNTGDFTPYLKKIAGIAENVVRESFATEGYGNWKTSTMKDKDNQQTLVESGQLRDSISSEIK